ncbi:MAG TPA: hypothetical protein PLD03_12905, partial [Thiomonas arsenitoxydans]|nr:hypothetical protein [Thiomonas arsenitoxydans]
MSKTRTLAVLSAAVAAASLSIGLAYAQTAVNAVQDGQLSATTSTRTADQQARPATRSETATSANTRAETRTTTQNHTGTST